MTETEADILDELYFVTSFKALSQMLDIDAGTLCTHLQALVSQGYVKCFFPDPDTEVEFAPETFAANCASYFFLATKAGLLAHNSR
ncbi:MarR family transcriptional regulator [Adhaeribacter sp. BT258]|uniref:MarR family transcriptional regulator n=1 Tax=Adhaeribacter terrigena TaxID=2793070 RepID=A0ABS1BZS2_9BACT|nr:MarR family transcriptional regulator [Adhaeribacter terrigena]MBK0402584.1 MarR family transcriptional regulator [Adhaeribacter terrigena]